MAVTLSYQISRCARFALRRGCTTSTVVSISLKLWGLRAWGIASNSEKTPGYATAYSWPASSARFRQYLPAIQLAQITQLPPHRLLLHLPRYLIHSFSSQLPPPSSLVSISDFTGTEPDKLSGPKNTSLRLPSSLSTTQLLIFFRFQHSAPSYTSITLLCICLSGERLLYPLMATSTKWAWGNNG